MALHGHAGLSFATRTSGLLQDQVARAIDHGSDVARLRPLDEMFTQRRLAQRGTRYRAQRGEVRPDGRWLEIIPRSEIDCCGLKQM